MYLGNDWSSRQLRKALIEEYPYLQPRRMTDGQVAPDYDYEFIVGEHDLPEGWLELFLQACEDIKEPLEKAGDLDKFRFMQVKEKFGRMRMYTNGATEEVNDILDKYEFLSEQVCSECGKPAIAMTRGWICPFCDEHIKKFTDRGEEVDRIEVQTSYVRRRWSAEGTSEIDIDCGEEWSRYLGEAGINCVFVIEKLVDFNTGERAVFSVYNFEDMAKARLDAFDGIQQVMLADGQIVPEYTITEKFIMN